MCGHCKETFENVHYPVGEPDWAKVKQANTGRGELFELSNKEIKINLHDFLIIPKKEGMVLLHEGGIFQHMVNFINLLCRKHGKLEPS